MKKPSRKPADKPQRKPLNFKPRPSRPGTAVETDELKRSLRIPDRDYYHFGVGMGTRIAAQREGTPPSQMTDFGQLIADEDDTISFYIPDHDAWSVGKASPMAEYLLYADRLEHKNRGSFLITGQASTVKVEDVELYRKPPNLLQVDFRFEHDKAVVDRIIIGEKQIECHEDNTRKALTLAMLCIDQMKSDKKLTFNANLRRVFQPGRKRGLRPIMTGPRN